MSLTFDSTYMHCLWILYFLCDLFVIYVHCIRGHCIVMIFMESFYPQSFDNFSKHNATVTCCRYSISLANIFLKYLQFTLHYVANDNCLRYDTTACCLFSYSWLTQNRLYDTYHAMASLRICYVKTDVCICWNDFVDNIELSVYVWVNHDIVILCVHWKFALPSCRGETILPKGGEGWTEDR